MHKTSIDSPVGPLTLWANDAAIVRVDWGRSRVQQDFPVLKDAGHQLRQYFEGERTAFDLALDPKGLAFQQSFYKALCAIPYGETRQYGDLARDLEVSAQAIGQACGANPIPILIPCHRVLAANGLGGYSGAGGVEAKVALLKLEGAASLLI